MSPKKNAAANEKINFVALVAALKACIIDKKPIRTTGRTYAIAKSSLKRYVDKVKANFDDLSVIHDDELLEFVQSVHTKTPSNMVCFFLLNYFIRTKTLL